MRARFGTVPLPGSGIGTGFPFAQMGLGSTDSCATAVHKKPFSTSVLQGLAGVFATTTKICTDDGSRQAHAQNPSAHIAAALLLVKA
ncbi:hypothetical protein GE061_020212 [Apolygus lucorum]|uniref:Uncharacterized protein n=1 Tax=Apolygus lucorum TaxID=248454 RepID=A0A6A4KKZ8_APOLU|nr:hypothetical protein GE061_020324 [Apolygus lucorum]KAF6197429.1 hypothetical protein GE061_020184 [Apolygus lucorum]KAF6197441.1 hypothetical protein GE061_020196 [Apolygus lucorum]KAF6197457.1 hypothetical protein GE061_020212 [Apolygus lucorum]